MEEKAKKRIGINEGKDWDQAMAVRIKRSREGVLMNRLRNRDAYKDIVADNSINRTISGNNKGKEQDSQQKKKSGQEKVAKKQRKANELRIRNGNVTRDNINKAVKKATGKKLSKQGEEKAQDSNTLVGKTAKEIKKEFKLKDQKGKEKSASKEGSTKEVKESNSSFLGRLLSMGGGKDNIETSLKKESKEAKKEKTQEKTKEKEVKKKVRAIQKDAKKQGKDGKISADRLRELSGRKTKSSSRRSSDFEQSREVQQSKNRALDQKIREQLGKEGR